jgi:DNA-binding Lrp family transcriptional regulator
MAKEQVFVLITTDVGKEQEVFKEINELSDVKEASLLYGMYDIIALLETNSTEKLKNTISWKIRQIPNVKSTISLRPRNLS